MIGEKSPFHSPGKGSERYGLIVSVIDDAAEVFPLFPLTYDLYGDERYTLIRH